MRADLNYHHLRHFHVVAREGSLTAASRTLDVAKPTLSAQVKALERAVGERLFERTGRGLALTEAGRVVQRYSEEIFALGRELQETLRGLPSVRAPRLHVGVVETMPKTIVHRVLTPCMRLRPPVRVVCREGPVERLLGALSVHELDVVLADAPMSGSETSVRAFNHLLGECGVTVVGAARHARRRRGFPDSLGGAPFLLPTEGALRRAFEAWADTEGLALDVVGEFQDSALLKVFGQGGDGLFVVPTAVEREVCEQYRVRVVGRIPEVRERFYAISVERRIRHPAVLALRDAAQRQLF